MGKDIGSWADYSPHENNMNKKKVVTLVSFSAVLFLSTSIFADLYYRMLFEKGVFLMEESLDPQGSINIFQEIVKRHSYDRYYAARSLLYIGICYKRKGSNQASQAFQEVIDNFPDQTAVVKIAEAELASLEKLDIPSSKASGEKKPRLVWEGNSVYGTGVVSSDGRYISFIDRETGDLELCELISGKMRCLNVLGSINGPDEYVECAAISPDAEWIAYGRKGRQGSEIRVVRLDGSRNRTLYKNKEAISIRPVDWTEDANRILVCLARSDFTHQIAFVSFSDGKMHVTKEMDLQRPDHMQLSPDGRCLAYSLFQDEDKPERDIYLYNLEEKKEIPIVVQPGDDLLLDWTPNGKNILYTNNQSGTTDIWLLAVQEGMAQQIPRQVKSDMGPVEPMGFARSGAFYFEAKPEIDSAKGGDRRTTEIWTLENFLPEEQKILTVPDDYPTIQSAVNAARPFDSVFVRKGVYLDNIVIGKSLTLQGEDRKTTIIDGGGNGNVVHIAASHVTVSDFTVRNGECGIEISSSWPIHHTTVRDTIITSNLDGIYSINSGGHHLIENCVISHNKRESLLANQFSRSIIRDCEVFGNGKGVRPAWGWYVSVEGNKVYGNLGGGICIDSCCYSTVMNNLVCSNKGSGIAISYIASRNMVKENIVFNNDMGISVGLPWDGFGENRVYHNDIRDNRIQVRGAQNSTNFQYWDNGYPSGGNFWSDYRGTDANRDGIGDQPHDLIDKASDNFPLMYSRNRIQASVKIDPEWTSLGDDERWITVSIELPANLPADSIEVSSLLLNDTVSPEEESGFVSDYDKDGVPEMMIKFDSRRVSRILSSSGDNVEWRVTGRLKSGIPFEGLNSLNIKHK
jgi:parallel beta-helix repeat protein